MEKRYESKEKSLESRADIRSLYAPTRRTYGSTLYIAPDGTTSLTRMTSKDLDKRLYER